MNSWAASELRIVSSSSFVAFLLSDFNKLITLLASRGEMKGQDKKKEQNGSANGDNLHVSENQTTDHEDIPLVLVNDGAESATVQAKQRKRSRAISSVSMSSDDEDTKEKQEVSCGTVIFHGDSKMLLGLQIADWVALTPSYD